jgi:hypothetical protein
MGGVVNLRTVKKQAARKEARTLATANAAKFGRSKSEKALEKAEVEKAARTLDDHQRERD